MTGRDALAIVGFAFLVGGVAGYSWRAALIVAGALLLLVVVAPYLRPPRKG